MGKVSSGTNGDIRVAYNVEIFSGATITENKPMRADILADKTKLEEKRIVFESRKSKASKIAPIIVSLFAIFLFILLVITSRNKRMIDAEIDRSYPTPYFVPEEAMSLPATLLYMGYGVIQAEGLTASLLDLVRKGYVKQENEDTFIVKDRNTDY